VRALALGSTLCDVKKKPYGSAHYVTQRTKADVRILNAVVRNLKTHGGLLAV
jgi:hypothetical protein